ncbi:unnamed protein product [Fusarium venenatum]|uniref:Uncharacterized protein n=1 Tax=Fusarium venenatum TaxID=56646 RepID=A0A2L2TUY8_9HYPO|nr:uncharacterized protein FVRRES_01812 [Fusarium venenatum]CEI65300.1 unnamed protein product [Fusarium venenatum]
MNRGSFWCISIPESEAQTETATIEFCLALLLHTITSEKAILATKEANKKHTIIGLFRWVMVLKLKKKGRFGLAEC